MGVGAGGAVAVGSVWERPAYPLGWPRVPPGWGHTLQAPRTAGGGGGSGSTPPDYSRRPGGAYRSLPCSTGAISSGPSLRAEFTRVDTSYASMSSEG